MQHGFTEIDVQVEDNLIIVKPDGAFNLEGVREYESKFSKLVRSFGDKTWGILNVYDTYETGGPEVQERVHFQFNWSCENGCRFLGFVVNNPLHEYAAKITTKDIENLQEMRIFRDHDEALTWIRGAIAKANADT